MKKLFLKIPQNSQENTCARVLFNKVAGLRPATLLKKWLWHRCFPVNFVKFLRTPFFYRTPLMAAFVCKVKKAFKSPINLFSLSLVYVFEKLQKQSPLSLTLLKKILVQLFSCENWKIFKNNFFKRTSPVAASEIGKLYIFLINWLSFVFAFFHIFNIPFLWKIYQTPAKI